MFINRLFNEALDITYRLLRRESGPISAHFDGHSNSSLYVIHNHYTNEKAVDAAYVNRSLVLQRHHGVPGEHDFHLGYCHNMTR